MTVKYLAGEDVLVMHHEIIEKTGGSYGGRDVGLLISAIERPKIRYEGKDLYKGIFEKAAAYLDSLARHHAFIDGNKRAAITASARFLFVNGYALKAGNREVENFVLRVVIDKLDIRTIAAWLRKHVEKYG